MAPARRILADWGIGRFWRVQLLFFDRSPAAAWTSRAGARLLAIFIVLELIARRLFVAAARSSGFTESRGWALAEMSLFVLVACGLVAGIARVPLSQLGLQSWRRWSGSEKLYLLQTVPLGVLIFSIANWGRLKILWGRPDLGSIALFVFVPQILWGFYQEFMYRGLLQNELVRRWGAWPGIIISNLIFTFGPLHAYHFHEASQNPSHLWIFAAIFAIGLYFGFVLRRSGNLWLPAILHGMGDCFIDGLPRVPKMPG